ncbi:hypothetical protein [Acinetobacter haemolyticus]|uniref:hypothetical protein n=1 Tax=Acinetobacter haemolyticus TaxID=29430 RepID=UPI000F747E18|nr:hypothetical protein [Acinetobacter haemolyticus]MCU4379246.1 hypothetical protein [Acinetobacter haemolyticus]MCU4388416.1 hypothetical protein [Acinetobacter haemolyticus]NAR36299.1 hypothetical protein [Acinetobacter haemolyticus]RSN73527.1 hypothetical protein EA769_15065 [Acinetobacter haemolyticus]
MTSPARTNNSKLLWMIIGGISLVVLIFFTAQLLLSDHTAETEITVNQPDLTTTSSENVEAASAAITSNITEESESAPIQLVEESILKAAVPENESLAKEEMAKLDDIQHQLKDQKQELQAQHHDADTLIKLKEEQIKLLEAQLLQTQAS